MNKQANKPAICPLCKGESTIFYQFKTRLYHQCKTCKGIFVDASLIPELNDEKLRYEEHHNDVNNKGYQKFVSPITNSILKKYSPHHKGLDFGAGTGPVIAKILKEQHYDIKLYDPFFHNSPSLLNQTYDYIACCEVIEHFHFPAKEFELLKKILNNGEALYCMTDIYDRSIDFHKWYYKNDLTHVFIYQKETLEWVKQAFGFSQLFIKDRLVTFIS